MLFDFVKRHDFDVVLLQEVACTDLLDVPGYSAVYNIGPAMRGTALLAKNEYHLHHIARLPSGRATAASYNDIRIINVYAP
jgi:exonuclease III